MPEPKTTEPDDAIDHSTLPEHLGGGEQKDEKADAQEQEVLTLRVGGKTFQVPAELAEAILEEQEDAKKAAKAPASKKENKEDKPRLKSALDTVETDIFTNPKKVFAEFKAELANEIREELTRMYTREEQQKEFWTTFYGQNKDLVGAEYIVKGVMSDRMTDLSDLTIDKARDKLATLVRKELLKITRSSQDGSKTEPDKTLVESGGRKTTKKAAVQQEEEKTASLSSFLKNRREARAAIAKGREIEAETLSSFLKTRKEARQGRREES